MSWPLAAPPALSPIQGVYEGPLETDVSRREGVSARVLLDQVFLSSSHHIRERKKKISATNPDQPTPCEPLG